MHQLKLPGKYFTGTDECLFGRLQRRSVRLGTRPFGKCWVSWAAGPSSCRSGAPRPLYPWRHCSVASRTPSTKVCWWSRGSARTTRTPVFTSCRCAQSKKRIYHHRSLYRSRYFLWDKIRSTTPLLPVTLLQSNFSRATEFWIGTSLYEMCLLL